MRVDDDIRAALRGQSKRDDDVAFRLLRQRYAREIFVCAFRILRQHDAAEDIIQETLLKVAAHREAVASADSIKAYLVTIAKNLSFSQLRTAKSRDAKLRAELPPRAAVANVSDDGENAALLACLEGVDASTRKALYLYTLYEMSWNEIAEVIGAEVDTVRMRVMRAQVRVRACLQGKGVAR